VRRSAQAPTYVLNKQGKKTSTLLKRWRKQASGAKGPRTTRVKGQGDHSCGTIKRAETRSGRHTCSNARRYTSTNGDNGKVFNIS